MADKRGETSENWNQEANWSAEQENRAGGLWVHKGGGRNSVEQTAGVGGKWNRIERELHISTPLGVSDCVQQYWTQEVWKKSKYDFKIQKYSNLTKALFYVNCFAR